MSMAAMAGSQNKYKCAPPDFDLHNTNGVERIFSSRDSKLSLSFTSPRMSMSITPKLQELFSRSMMMPRM